MYRSRSLLTSACRASQEPSNRTESPSLGPSNMVSQWLVGMIAEPVVP
jgi:hypothetical protein